MKKQSLLFRLLLFYGSRVPYHRGKGWLIERLLRFFNLHVGEEFDLVREGLRWRLNPADFVQADVFWLGRKDYYDLYHLQRMLQPGHVFLDVGANFGYYSVVLASRLNKRCVIHAFEPNPPTLERLHSRALFPMMTFWIFEPNQPLQPTGHAIDVSSDRNAPSREPAAELGR